MQETLNFLSLHAAAPGELAAPESSFKFLCSRSVKDFRRLTYERTTRRLFAHVFVPAGAESYSTCRSNLSRLV